MRAQVLKKYDESMKAQQWLSTESIPEPRVENSTDVVVRIGAAGVCRTDLHIIEGVWKAFMDPDGTRLLPMVLGHENAGWIEEVGSEAQGLKKGDPVIVHPKISDGLCLACRRGEDMHGPGPFPGVDCNGGYTELLKTSVRNIVKLPQTVSPRDVAAHADAGLTAYRVAKKATRTLLPGQFCVVIGIGGLGHIGLQCLKAMCAAEIIAVDNSKAGIELARECGADHVVNADGTEVERVMSLTQGQGAEAVIDFVGERGTTAKGLSMTRAQGTYFVVGYGEDIRIPAAELVLTERSIVGNLVGTWAELTELIALADKGRVNLVTQSYPLQDANRALQDLHHGKVKGRAVLVP
jgi:NAD+-dependent secondary alcohol dehydrogenase Adh1